MHSLEKIIPHIPSRNIETTVNFLFEIFGFTAQSQMEFYCELTSRDNTLGILKSEDEPNQQSIYLQVSDVDNLWTKIGTQLRKVNAKPPFNQDYGMREIHVIIPETNTRLLIGSRLIT